MANNKKNVVQKKEKLTVKDEKSFKEKDKKTLVIVLGVVLVTFAPVVIIVFVIWL